MFSNKKLAVLVFVVLAAASIVVGILAGMNFASQGSSSAASEYSAVYLQTGDIYFGKLSWFPWPRLTHVWLTQRSADQNSQGQFSLVPFAKSFWGPMDEVYLNPKEIVFWTRLRNDSQVVAALRNFSLSQGQPQEPAPSSAPSSSSSSSAPAKKK